MAADASLGANADAFEREVAERFGVLPNLFCVADAAPGPIEALWRFAKSAYLDNPLPSLFKERLFVHLSRFCPVRYCLIRHVGFLIGHGRPAGDAAAVPQTIEEAVELLRRAIPEGPSLATVLGRLEALPSDQPLPAPRTALEYDLFDALTRLFLCPAASPRAMAAVRRAIGESTFERLIAYLAYIRTAHYWTETHPELACEPDVAATLGGHSELATLLLDTADAELVHNEQRLRRALDDLERSHAISEERRELVLKAGGMGAWDYDMVADVCHFDAHARALYGLTSDVLDHRPESVVAVVHPDDVVRMFEAIRQASDPSGDGSYDIDYRVARGDGQHRWLRAWGKAEFEGEGAARRAVRIVGVSRDVTREKEADAERAHAESGLRESEEKYRSLFNAIDEGYCLVQMLYDEAGKPVDLFYLEANPTFERLAGFAATGRKISEFVELEAYWLETYQRVLETGEPERIENYVAAQDRWYYVFASRVGGAGSTLIAAVFDDITERKREALRRDFLLELADALRPLTDPIEVQDVTVRMLGQKLHVDRCYYAEFDWSSDVLYINREYVGSESFSVIGSHPISAFQDLLQFSHKGEPLVCDDIAAHPIFSSEIAAYRQRGTDGFILIPLIKQGVMAACMCVTMRIPRKWSAVEIQLVREVADRTRDAVERARAEQALRESEERQAFLLRLSDALRPVVDPVAVQEMVSRMTAEYLDIGRIAYCEVRHEPHVVVVIERDWPRRGMPSVVPGRYVMDDFGAALADDLADGRLSVVAEAATDTRFSAADRRNWAAFGVVASCSLPIIKDGQLVACVAAQDNRRHDWTDREIALLREVSERTWAAVERARAEGALQQAHDLLERRVRERTSEVQSVFQRLVSAQEEERRRLARDIHDQLGQQMTALRMNLEALRSQSAGHAALVEQAERTQRLAEELDQSIDFLTWELRPAALDHLGLSAALRKLVIGWSERFGVAADFDVLGIEDVRLPRDVEANLYRIAQEALHNIAKHAAATHATVVLTQQGGHLVLVVEDNGRGISPRADAGNDTGDGLGLVSMRERAALVGGQLHIESSSDRGTSIYVRVPEEHGAHGRR